VIESAILALEDGTVFEGISVGAPGMSVGEVVFNTAITGYQEILTDPSYARQLVTLTSPHVGNTGCTAQDDESARVFAAGLIVRDVPRRPSNWRSQVALPEWLRDRGVVAISDIDTRRLTRLLRDPRLWALGAANAFVMTLYALWTNWTTLYFVVERGLSQNEPADHAGRGSGARRTAAAARCARPQRACRTTGCGPARTRT